MKNVINLKKKNRFLRDPKTNGWNRRSFIWVIFFQSSFGNVQGVVQKFMPEVTHFFCKSIEHVFVAGISGNVVNQKIEYEVL